MLCRFCKARFEATLRACDPALRSLPHHLASKNGKEQANTCEDLCRLFAQGMDELCQLFFLLTDHQKAEQCFVAGLEDSVKSNRVFKEWARSWEKRTIIEMQFGN